jgi:hypothetical protein
MKNLTIKPRIIVLQNHKIPESDCFMIGTLGLHKGTGFCNGGISNTKKHKWKARIAIVVSTTISHTITNTKILVPNRAQWITYSLDQKVIGFLNLYTPNKGPEQGTFWNQIANTIPPAESWVLGNDFNMVEMESDYSSNTLKKLNNDERKA